jgi:recombination protein RecT
MVRCAKDGLLPDGREAALVKVKTKGRDTVAYWPMVGGFRRIAAQHGIVIAADVVRANDFFEWSKVPPRLDHRPAPLGEDRGDPRGAYAVALYQADNRFVTSPVVMDVAEIERVRAVSRAATSEYGPWVNWWDRMACKTVARRLFSELPLADVDERTRSVVEAASEIDEMTAPVPELASLPVEVDDVEPEVVEA